MATALYMRVSDEKQDEGISFETQEEKSMKLCDYRGFSNVKKYNEIKSARTMKSRVKLKQLLGDVKAGRIKRVIIYKLDRLTRSLRDLMNLLHFFDEHNCELHSTYENIDSKSPSGRMLVQVLGIIAEWESANTSKRVKDNMTTRAKQGIWMSSIPFGFDHGEDKRLKINEHESNILKEAFGNVFEGMSFTASEEKITKKYDLDWSENYLARKAKMPSTVGDIYRDGKLYEDVHPAIISKKERDKLLEILDKNKTGRRFMEQDDLFRRRVICSECGSTMSVNTRSHDNYKTKYHSYICSECPKNGKPFMSVSEKKLEEAFYDYMKNIPIIDIDKKDIEEDEKETQIKALLRRMNNINRERDKIQRAWIKNMMSDKDLDKYQKELDGELMQIEDELSKLRVKNVVISEEELEELISYFNSHFKRLDRKEKRSFIQQHIRHIEYERTLIKGYKKKYNTKITNVEFF